MPQKKTFMSYTDSYAVMFFTVTFLLKQARGRIKQHKRIAMCLFHQHGVLKKFTGEIILSQQNINTTDRECSRIPRGVHVEVKKIEYPLSNEPGEKSTTRNIAKRGICFTASRQYKPGETLSLNIRLNGWYRHRKGLAAILNNALSQTDVLTVIAEVIWSKKSTHISGSNIIVYDIGVKFINIYEDDQIALEKYFSKILPG